MFLSLLHQKKVIKRLRRYERNSYNLSRSLLVKILVYTALFVQQRLIPVNHWWVRLKVVISEYKLDLIKMKLDNKCPRY